jgi:DNA replication protein DnaC
METEIKKPFQKMTTKEIEYTCDKHGKVKSTLFSLNGVFDESFARCPICEEEAAAKEEAEQRERVKRNERMYFENEMQERNIEPEYFDKELDDFIPETKEQAEALSAVKEMIETRKGKIILLGSNGVGKTMLGSLAVKKLGGKILSMYEITTMIRQSYSPKAEKSELEIVKNLASIPLLVIDEMGRTKGSEAELNWLSYILDKRHTRQLPFMILSNTHLSRDCPKKGCEMCFERFVNNDVLSRLRQNSKIISIKAPDYRARKTK